MWDRMITRLDLNKQELTEVWTERINKIKTQITTLKEFKESLIDDYTYMSYLQINRMSTIINEVVWDMNMQLNDYKKQFKKSLAKLTNQPCIK